MCDIRMCDIRLCVHVLMTRNLYSLLLGSITCITIKSFIDSSNDYIILIIGSRLYPLGGDKLITICRCCQESASWAYIAFMLPEECITSNSLNKS